MSGENRLRREIVKILRPLHAQPVENLVKVGCPDVEFSGGWIEVKRTKEWPIRENLPVRLDHDMTPEQRIWAKRRARAGGAVWLLLQIDQDYLLLSGVDAARMIGEATRAELMEAAAHTCVGLSELKRNLLEWVK